MSDKISWQPPQDHRGPQTCGEILCSMANMTSELYYCMMGEFSTTVPTTHECSKVSAQPSPYRQGPCIIKAQPQSPALSTSEVKSTIQCKGERKRSVLPQVLSQNPQMMKMTGTPSGPPKPIINNPNMPDLMNQMLRLLKLVLVEAMKAVVYGSQMLLIRPEILMSALTGTWWSEQIILAQSILEQSYLKHHQQEAPSRHIFTFFSDKCMVKFTHTRSGLRLQGGDGVTFASKLWCVELVINKKNLPVFSRHDEKFLLKKRKQQAFHVGSNSLCQQHIRSHYTIY